MPAHLDSLREGIDRERPVSIGECGLDFFIEGLDHDTERLYFQRQLELAKEFALPLLLHARHAVEEVTLALRQLGGLRGVVRSLSGSQHHAEHLWKIGFHLGIGGPVTYPNATRLRAVVAQMPIEWLLLQTHSPDQLLHGHRGERNEPARTQQVLGVIAALRAADTAAMALQMTRNARTLSANSVC